MILVRHADAAAAVTRRRLWLHCVGSSLPSLERQAERALLLARDEDVVCVPRPLDPEYLGYLASLGLGPSAANVVVAPPASGGAGSLAARLLADPATPSRIIRRMASAPFALDPYAGTPDVFTFAEALERAAGRPVPVLAPPPAVATRSARLDLARDRAVELGIPVADGEVVLLPPHGRRRRDLEPLRDAIGRRLRAAGRVLVRGAGGTRDTPRHVIGLGGEDADDVLREAALRAEVRSYVVESLVETAVCSTVHLDLEPATGDVHRLGIVDRRVGRGLATLGNRAPSVARTAECMERWAVALAEWLRGLGYVGRLGLDFAEYRDDAGRPRALFTGVVPRAGAGGYALTLGKALGAAACVSGTAATRLPDFSRVRAALGGLLYHPDRAVGVVPYATGWLEHGRCPLVAVGADRLHAAELLGKAEAALEGEPVGRLPGR